MLNQRLQEFRKRLKLGTQGDLAKILNVNIDRVKSLEGTKVKNIKAEELNILVDKFHLNSDWLLTGKGEMLLSNETNNTTYSIDVLGGLVSAGVGGGDIEAINKVGSMQIDKSFFRTKPILENLKIFQIFGDSMEPTIKNGDFIIIDTKCNLYINDIYVIKVDNELYCKRLQFNTNQSINVISDNKNYQIETYDHENELPFEILGRKILTIIR